MDYGADDDFQVPVKKGGHAPTKEQRKAMELFSQGGDLVIEAGAGTGKTSTLCLLAGISDGKGQYTAFNKAIVEDSKAKMPPGVQCNTAHSLAFRAIGRNYGHRLGSNRMKPSELATRLGIRQLSIRTPFSKYEKHLEPWQLAGFAKVALQRFCQSADKEPDIKHFAYIEGIDGEGSYANQEKVAQYLLPAVVQYWEDAQDEKGVLPYAHDHYLKKWERSKPVIQADYLLVDEAQDINPVLMSIIQQQQGVQIVWVGDSNQEIYAWAGAVNSLQRVKAEHRCFLTKSFRFGPSIADRANRELELLGAEMRLTGCDRQSVVGPVDKPKAVLSRTNAAAVEGLLLSIKANTKAHLVGGGDDVIRLMEGIAQLKTGRKSSHPDLQCFDTYDELIDYVKDEAGAELKLPVQLEAKYGGKVIAEAIRTMPSEDRAEVVFSTAHKSKGREWSTVKIASDFARQQIDKKTGMPKPPSPADRKLRYVSITRAKDGLDDRALVEKQEEDE